MKNLIDSSKIADLRVNYSLKSFSETDLLPNPFEQFSVWFEEALAAQLPEPNAMTLATVKPSGSPSARIVLLKGFSDNGFVFFTNYESNKGMQLEQNNKVALVFCWLELQRQVRIEGIAAKISPTESDSYFTSRPLNSQIGAHASPQSSPINSREELEKRYALFEKRFSNTPIIRPSNWGGYCVSPLLIEFWQGRENRLHDRFVYEKNEQLRWETTRLAP
jgi:pyridoxamine 5'-phosphate oxidase